MPIDNLQTLNNLQLKCLIASLTHTMDDKIKSKDINPDKMRKLFYSCDKLYKTDTISTDVLAYIPSSSKFIRIHEDNDYSETRSCGSCGCEGQLYAIVYYYKEKFFFFRYTITYQTYRGERSCEESIINIISPISNITVREMLDIFGKTVEEIGYTIGFNKLIKNIFL